MSERVTVKQMYFVLFLTTKIQLKFEYITNDLVLVAGPFYTGFAQYLPLQDTYICLLDNS